MTGKLKGGMFLALAVVLAAGLASVGCGPSEEDELNKQILAQIAVIDREVKALERHQESMRGIVIDMQTQVNLMQEELNRSAPRIHAAKSAVSYLGELTTVGFGESPARYTLRTSHQWGWTTIGLVSLFLFIIWLFYRLRYHSTPQQ